LQLDAEVKILQPALLMIDMVCTDESRGDEREVGELSAGVVSVFFPWPNLANFLKIAENSVVFLGVF
jgi:hypothetical protein